MTTAVGAGFWSKTLLLARKDLRIELRARDTLVPMLFFAITVTLMLAFTLPAVSGRAIPRSVPPGTVVAADVLAGFLWVTILFAGLIGFARTFESERAEGAIESLLLVPLDRSGLFAAKAVANLTHVVVVEIVVVPLFALLFGLDLRSQWWGVAAVLGLADIGFVAIGTLFASLAAQTGNRELILPILSLPALVPLFIAAVELTADLFVGEGLGTVAAGGWFGILIAFDVVFTIVGALAFEFVVE